MKYIRAAVAVAVIAVSILLAMPGLLANDAADTGATVDATSTVAPAPTPNYDEIAPAVTAEPVSEATAIPESTAMPQPQEEAEGMGPQYVLDLWLDASPNVAGVSPFDGDQFRRGEDGYGKWLGGYFYTCSAYGSDKEISQEGWAPYLLNLLYGKEVAGLGSVRILRLAQESMFSQDQLAMLGESYPDLDIPALIRDSLTYHVIRNNSENHLAFFRGLIQTSGRMDPGAGNPYALKDCFFYPNNFKFNNRVVADKSNTGKGADSDCDWQRETADASILSAVDVMMDSTIQNYNQKVLANQPSDAAAPEADDYLYYALNAMDPSRLNVLVLDTLGLPELDQHTQLYSERIREMIAENGGDLAVGHMAFQLDYAGKISSIGGRSLENGFLWGFENVYKYLNGKNYTTKWGFVQPMPRAMMMLVIGPEAQVENYTSVLCRHIEREMQEGGSLSGTRGEPSGRVDSSYVSPESFKFLGESFVSPVFSFQYKCSVMKYMDIVQEQSILMDVLSQRLKESEEGLQFASDELPLETENYVYDTTLGNHVSEENVPVVTTNFLSPLVLSLDLALQETDSFTVAEGQYDSSITVTSALETQSFTLEEIDQLSRTGELDLSASSDILGDQARIGLDDRIYKYHLTDGSGLVLNASQPSIVDGRLQLTLTTDVVPPAGYYWVTLQMRSKALAELDNQNWNTIQVWMQEDTSASGYDAEMGPAVLHPTDYSWDYTPETYDLNSYATTDSKLDAAGNSFAYVTKSERLHHAWGSSLTANSNIFPADIPPVFRLFQYNRITSSIRNGLLDRSGTIDSAPFLTRHFIICVPENMTAGEQ